MKDREFLIWLHQRLVNVHDEDYDYDYMHRLRDIILNTDKDKFSPNCRVDLPADVGRWIE